MFYRIFTDGSCLGNPGAGGWAAIIVDDEKKCYDEFFGGEANTTNNRMELTAAIRALENISTDDRAELFTDSSYLKNAFTNGWLAKWKRNGWRTSAKNPVLNKDLWLALDELISSRAVRFNWVKGHAGNFFNERCDMLARRAAEKIQRDERLSSPKISEPVALKAKEQFRDERHNDSSSSPRINPKKNSTPVTPKVSTPENNLPKGQLRLF